MPQTHYGQFLEFRQCFADWSQLLNVQLADILAALPQLREQLGGIKSDTEEILALIRQLMARGDLSEQVKLRDELTQYSSANLELIKKAGKLWKAISRSDPQYSRVAIGLGSIVSSQGDLQQAEALFTKANQQANNDAERALSQFNLFQVFIRQADYDKAFAALETAILLDGRYALHNQHTYTIKRILGAGGMGCVFLAQHRFDGKLVVIKCFWETAHSSADTLFKEAFYMKDIAGEYIPKPLDCGFVDPNRQERGYFISEYIEGAIDGEAWLKRYGKLDVATGIAVGLQIAKGLQIAHDRGIFHLDLKPANILLQRQKTSEVSVKIIDFGLAKVAPNFGTEMATQRSRSGLSLLAQTAVFGTLDYAPPEQQGVDGEPSAKSDVYAFGKTLYRLLTGESPQTLHPRCLSDAPKVFELLCDCVEIEPDRRVGLVDLMQGLEKLLSPVSEQVKQSPKPVARIIQQKKPRIVKIDKRLWWNQLYGNWEKIFKKAIGMGFFRRNFGEVYDSDLEKIINLQKLSCSHKQISDLEPIRALTNLQQLYCPFNKITDLEPLCALTNLQNLFCERNQISDLEPLRVLTNLQLLDCGENQISDLEPLRALTNLQLLECYGNPISKSEIERFKKVVPNCEVYS